jgi:hypothetical protein
MPIFEVSGTVRESGRKRRRGYRAPTADQARTLAEADGMVISTIVELPPEPPTESQLAYAKDLGVVTPADASKDEVSDLIDARLQRDKPAAPSLHALAAKHGVTVTQYTGKKALFDRLFLHLSEPGREEDLAAWFTFRVYRELVDGNPDATIKDPDDPTIRAIAQQLVQDEGVIRSIRRYENGRDLIWFGEWTAPDGTLHQGGSNQTVAYKRAASLLRERAAREVRAAPAVQPRPDRARPGRAVSVPALGASPSAPNVARTESDVASDDTSPVWSPRERRRPRWVWPVVGALAIAGVVLYAFLGR